jgi:hypothetical protein
MGLNWVHEPLRELASVVQPGKNLVSSTREAAPVSVTLLVRHAQLLGCELGDLFRIAGARTGDLDHPARDNLANGIIAIN